MRARVNLYITFFILEAQQVTFKKKIEATHLLKISFLLPPALSQFNDQTK